MVNSLTKSAVGIGLRAPHYNDFLSQKPKTDFLEIHSENYFSPFSKQSWVLDQLAQDYQLSCHGIGLSLGSSDPLDASHLSQLKALLDRYQPALVSEHLSWSSVEGNYFNDLLPMPYTREALAHFVDKVDQTQDYIGRQLLVENPSAYLQFKKPEMSEWEFLSELAERTGCGLLLDLNNIYVSSINLKFCPEQYLAGIPHNAVGEIHLAGFTLKGFEKGELLIDTHGTKVSPMVWQLYENYIQQHAVPTLIEWDTDIPAIDVLLAEQQKALDIRAKSRTTG